METRPKAREICRTYAERHLGLKVWEKEGTVFIEGSSEALRFLADLFLAHAHAEEDCGFGISPNGGGSAFFDPASEKGLYIHRVPCKESSDL